MRKWLKTVSFGKPKPAYLKVSSFGGDSGEAGCQFSCITNFTVPVETAAGLSLSSLGVNVPDCT